MPSSKGKPANSVVPKWLQAHVNHDGRECLIWPFARNDDGRAVIRMRGRTTKAARVMCMLVHGKPPRRQMQTAHSCGNGHLGCVNPKHLRWATQSENEMDRVAHGTSNRGERHGMSKLTEAQARAILTTTGISQENIAQMFGVSRRTVGFIKRGQRWGWL